MNQDEAAALLARSHEIVESDFTDVDFRGILPRETSTPWVFRQCVFQEASLAGLDLRGATFDRCRVDSADFGEAKLDDSVWLGVTGTKLDATRVSALRARFERCVLLEAEFTQSALAEASFRATRLTGGSFHKARFRDTRFEDCHLVAVDLRGVSLHRQKLIHVDLSDANLSGADVREASFDGCVLRGARLIDAKFTGADLRGADIGTLTPAACGALRGAVISAAQAADLVRGLGLEVR